ncbi:MAG: universal stress protein [Hyphomicrobiaceae bacterium]|nr:universal stress protein [Hyphomicrobiaceae bacterium]
MFQNILVAVDGSPHAHRAATVAAAIADKFGAPLTILYVMPRLGSADTPAELTELGRTEHVSLTEADLLRNAAQSVVDAAKDAVTQFGLHNVTTMIDHGDAAERIIACCKRHDIDLIVMGRRGLGDLAGLLMGSVSQKISHLAPCPCLTVPVP